MGRMTDEQKAARKAEREAKRKADMDAWVEREIAKIEPLTDEQLCKIVRIMRGERVSPEPRVPSAYELEQRRQYDEQAAALKEAERLAEAMLVCDMCDLSPAAHRAQRHHGVVGFHDWVPGRAQKIMQGTSAN